MLLLCAVLLIGGATGCGSENNAGNTGTANNSEAETNARTGPLSGHHLQIFCDVDMQAPVADITTAFEQQSGASAEIIFGSEEQLTNQIRSRYTGDIFIAAAENETGTLNSEGYIAASLPLVERQPVLAVPAGNPGRITNLKALSRKTVYLADKKSDLIGNVGIQILSDNGIDPAGDNISFLEGHEALLTALQSGEADAAIVWNEPASEAEGVQVLHSADLSEYSKTVPALSLSTCSDKEAQAAYLEFLKSGDANKIWKKHNYSMAS